MASINRAPTNKALLIGALLIGALLIGALLIGALLMEALLIAALWALYIKGESWGWQPPRCKGYRWRQYLSYALRFFQGTAAPRLPCSGGQAGTLCNAFWLILYLFCYICGWCLVLVMKLHVEYSQNHVSRPLGAEIWAYLWNICFCRDRFGW